MNLSKAQVKALECTTFIFSTGLLGDRSWDSKLCDLKSKDVDNLKNEGLIRLTSSSFGLVQSDRVYTLTPAGRQALEEALNGK